MVQYNFKDIEKASIITLTLQMSKTSILIYGTLTLQTFYEICMFIIAHTKYKYPIRKIK